jgi:HSP20 family molecular chaperone IbpA
LSDISIYERHKQLTDIQDAYERKKQDATAKGEADLAEIRRNYKEKNKQAVDAGEAVVSHIKKNRDLAATQIYNQNRETIEVARAKLEANQKEVQKTQDEQSERLHAAQQQVKKATEQEIKQINDYRNTNRESHAHMQENANKQLNTLKTELDTKLRARVEDNHKKIEKLEADHNRKVSTILAASMQEQSRMEEINAKNYKQTKEGLETQFQRMNEQNRHQVQAERDSHIKRIGAVQKEYRTEVEKAEDMNTRSIKNRRDRFDFQKNRQEDYFRKETAELKGRNEAQVRELKSTLNAEVVRSQKQHEDRLDKMRKDFDRVFSTTDKINKETLHNQRENIMRAIANQRKELLSKTKDYGSMQSDPFYSIVDYGSKVEEHENGYIFSTHLPQLEKQNVNVKVSDGKVLLQGARTFNDEVEKDDKKLNTSNYQTFHEEFKLNHPVDEKKVTQFYDQEVLTVFIPRK